MAAPSQIRIHICSTLGPSPPAAKAEMDKGKGGKGKKWTSWPREVGTYPYLKNFRKGLHHQLDRCLRDLRVSRPRNALLGGHPFALDSRKV